MLIVFAVSSKLTGRAESLDSASPLDQSAVLESVSGLQIKGCNNFCDTCEVL